MSKEKVIKTNAMRILDFKKINYEIITYESNDGKIDGISVANKIGIDEDKVFKTLVAQGTSKELYVFVIPVAKELNLKQAAIISKEKKVEMIHRDANPSNIMFEGGNVTGFIDFALSERNVRLFDPCYCATGILSEAGDIEDGFDKWPEILKGILKGYDEIVHLENEEIQAIPYVIYSIQMIFIAWLIDNEAYKNCALQNRKMLVWMWENKERCFQ